MIGTTSRTIIGAKVRVIGDAVLEQDSLLRTIALGARYKINQYGILGFGDPGGADQTALLGCD